MGLVMEYGVKCWAAIERGFVAIVLTMLVLSTSLVFASRGVLAADVGALIKALDRSEWEIVSQSVTDRIPNLIKGKKEQAHFKEVMKRSQQVAAMAEALQDPNINYEGLGALSAGILAEDMEKMVANRFGEDSRLYRPIQLVKK
jgi:hypothetical protein